MITTHAHFFRVVASVVVWTTDNLTLASIAFCAWAWTLLVFIFTIITVLILLARKRIFIICSYSIFLLVQVLTWIITSYSFIELILINIDYQTWLFYYLVCEHSNAIWFACSNRRPLLTNNQKLFVAQKLLIKESVEYIIFLFLLKFFHHSTDTLGFLCQQSLHLPLLITVLSNFVLDHELNGSLYSFYITIG